MIEKESFTHKVGVPGTNLDLLRLRKVNRNLCVSFNDYSPSNNWDLLLKVIQTYL